MECIECGRETNFTAVRAGIEAGFCHYHFPQTDKTIPLVIRIVC